jgi:Domain of unknown function (DUF1835)
MKPAVHITHGQISGAVLRELYPHDHVIALTDSLSVGPVISVVDEQSWTKTRSDFWHEFVWSLKDHPHIDDYHAVACALEKLNEAARIFLWTSRCLDEQLALVWAVMLLKHFAIDLSKVRLVKVTKRVATGVDVLTLGALGPDDLRGEASKASLLSGIELRSIEGAWAALSSCDPRALMRFVETTSIVLPDLKNGMRFLMLRYPKVENGLSYIDRRLLEACGEEWLAASRLLGKYMGRYYHRDLDMVGDVELFVRLLNMGRGSLRHPLVEIEGDVAAMRSTRARVTDVGRDVLSGKASHVELNGIDEWIGGVHLKAPPGPVWFYENGTLTSRGGSDQDRRG